MAKNILILYITESSGHYRAALSLKEALLLKNSDISVSLVNAFRYYHPLSEKVINFFYYLSIKRFPFLWGRIYDKKAVVRNLNPLKSLVHFLNLKKTRNLLEKFQPACIITTQAFPCGVVAFYKRYYHLSIPLVGVVTDFFPHGFWPYREVDFYTVATPEAKDKLVSENIPREKIKILGIPIMPKFVQENNRQAVASEFGLAPDKKTILLMGGGSGLGPLEKIVEVLDNSYVDFQMIVVCGRNRKLYRRLSSYRRTARKELFLFSYTEDVDKFMDFAEIIITKAGGSTISEALAKKMAIIAFRPIPGQEENNIRYLKEKEIAFLACDYGEIKLQVERLLQNRDMLERFREKAYNYAHPASSLEIAELSLKLIE